MTNDYFFRAMLQRNNKVLRGLICSLLHMAEKQVQCISITNPIILGEAINEKEFFLDVNVLLNDATVINLEMQVINEYNWPERSLSYLCRNFNTLNRGEDYTKYSDKLRLSVLDLTQINLAAEEDRTHHTDCWAAFFKAATWEEIRMLAQKDEYIQEASDTICELTQEERIRLQCEAREDIGKCFNGIQQRQKQRQEVVKEQAYGG